MLKLLLSAAILLFQPNEMKAEGIYLTEKEYLHVKEIDHHEISDSEFISIILMAGNKYLSQSYYDREGFEKAAIQLSNGLYDNRDTIKISNILDEIKDLVFENDELINIFAKTLSDVESHIYLSKQDQLENHKLMYRYQKIKKGDLATDVINIMGNEKPDCHKDQANNGYFCEWFRSYRLFFGPHAPEYMNVYQIKFNQDEVVTTKLNYGFI